MQQLAFYALFAFVLGIRAFAGGRLFARPGRAHPGGRAAGTVDGERESKLSWQALLSDLKKPGTRSDLEQGLQTSYHRCKRTISLSIRLRHLFGTGPKPA